MALARLEGGPLDGQMIPLADPSEQSLIVPYGEGQLVYRRVVDDTAGSGGPAATRYAYVEATEDIDPDPDQRDD